MLSHELARILLENPNLPIATHANNHTYMSENDKYTHGMLKVGILETYKGKHIVIGNFGSLNINKPNWYVSELIRG